MNPQQDLIDQINDGNGFQQFNPLNVLNLNGFNEFNLNGLNQNNILGDSSQPKIQGGGKFSDIFNWFNLIMLVAIFATVGGFLMFINGNNWGLLIFIGGVLLGWVGFADDKTSGQLQTNYTQGTTYF